jgi:2-aminoethylphosphonate-pyruvate transaminase
MYEHIPDNPYFLLTPGPLSTSKGVRAALLRDWCTWDADYNENIVQNIRRRIVSLATKNTGAYTVVLMQGSGSFAVEACIGTAIPKTGGKLLALHNGAYGKRIALEAKYYNIPCVEYGLEETEAPDAAVVAEILANDPEITHVAVVHCETTTGILNPIADIAKAVKDAGRIVIVDSMSGFGGIPLDVSDLGIDYLVSSANKCIQGVPGFAFVVARRSLLEQCEGNARSLSLDLYDQWKEMDKGGKWRFTSPTHTVRAFYQALDELEAEGGTPARYARYSENQRILAEGMEKLGFRALLPKELQSPIITSFLYPSEDFDFADFYQKCKARGFVLYPGKISRAPTFRIGNIGEVYPVDIRNLLEVVAEVRA